MSGTVGFGDSGNGGIVKNHIVSALVGIFALAGIASAQTDMTGAPDDWRGTPIDGSSSLVGTNKYGEPLFVTINQDVAPAFSPAAITGERLADEFKALCLDTGLDPDTVAAAAAKSGFKFEGKTLTVDPQKKGRPGFTARIWHAPEARVQIWTGDTSGVDGYPAISRWRRGATISPFNTNRTLVPSCGLTVMARGFTSPDGFLKRLEGFIGRPGTKIVTKPEWADGHWLSKAEDGTETRISYSMVDFDKSEQLLHVSLSVVPPKAKKK